MYGAGCINRPRVMFVFMNPTGRNVSASVTWKGLRAPWIGTKQVWQLFYNVGIVSKQLFNSINELSSQKWTPDFAQKLYTHIAQKDIYITNLAKCTQKDARALNNSVFQKYLHLIHKEISAIDPYYIISFGNQVSSLLLGKAVRVSSYKKTSRELLTIGNKVYAVYPTYYPVGQGGRNMPHAQERIKRIMLLKINN